MAKPKGSAKQLSKASANKQQSSKGGNSTKGQAKKGTCQQKKARKQGVEEDDGDEEVNERNDEEEVLEEVEVEQDTDKAESDLEEQHHGKIPDNLPLKVDTIKDLLVIFSQHISVKFKKNSILEILVGRWCAPCRASLKKVGQRKAFFIGGNLTCRAHICQHYMLYKEHCKEGNIPENHHAIP
ncbi:hypothetical protein BJV74DRAFT_800232 [Russula compacta]|nr:hypothetical protein BJV74DRAFT_800232 [Russula compacta]